MRHKISGNKLGRRPAWRKATVRDLAKATLKSERIQTTKIKAKEARKLVDRLITLGKKNTLAAKRRAFAILSDHKLVSNLFSAIAPRFKNRQGGYTRIIPLGTRPGDNAAMAYLELTERAAFEPKTSKKPKKSSRSKEAPLATGGAASGEAQEQTQPPKPEAAGKPMQKRTDRGDSKDKSSKKIVGGIKKLFKKDAKDEGKKK